ncbi:MAG: peptidoglycan DD-metalloendopeptidase family protein [Tahibacter sp.]
MRGRLWMGGLLVLLGASGAAAQSGTGVGWEEFGPDRSHGVFVNITRQHLISENAQGIAVDSQKRILVLNEWNEAGNSNADCAVTRHLTRARLIDMSYTGPEELEGTRRIAPDLGGTNYDLCTAIDVDTSDRAVVSGAADTGSGLTGFVARQTANGFNDVSFATGGKFALNSVPAFSSAGSFFNHVQAVANSKTVACGYVQRGSERNMVVVRLTVNGDLDPSFNGTGYREIDFNGGGSDTDMCTRIAVLPLGAILLGGTASDAFGNAAYALVKLDVLGEFAADFSGDGRLLIDDGSQVAATPSLADLVYDGSQARILVGCNLSFSVALDPSSCIIALTESGAFDTSFDGDGRMSFRFSNYGLGARDAGGSKVKRLLPRGDGSFFVLGTHTNSPADAAEYGASDVVSLRLERDGGVRLFGPAVYSGSGIEFHVFPQVAHSGVSAATDNVVADVLVDATLYRGNLLLLADRPRYPNNVFDHDNDGNLDEPGPIAPLVASIVSDSLFESDFDFDGLDRPTTGLQPVISIPAGYGNYCSVINAANATSGLLAQGSGSDPCQVFLNTDPNLIIERSGLYSLAGKNWVMGACGGGTFVTIRVGTGTAPFDQVFADATGRSNCIYTAAPDAMPILARPYTGTPDGDASRFNHDPYNIPINVQEFAQTAGPYDACYIDNKGRQHSIGNPDVPNQCVATDGVDEPASDIPVDNSSLVQSMASGRVMMAVPRHVPTFAIPGNDPYQREIFIRHQVGSGTYAEVFSSYYAHMQYTAVRRGDIVSAGTVLGRVGTTGSSFGEHVHVSVSRHRNLSWRKTFEFNFSGMRWDRNGNVSAVDPWGWRATQGADPWAWRFRDTAGDTRDDAGCFSTNLWISGQAPPQN